MNIYLGKRERERERERETEREIIIKIELTKVCVCVCVFFKNVRDSIDQAGQKCLHLLRALQTRSFLEHCSHSHQVHLRHQTREQRAEVEHVVR